MAVAEDGVDVLVSGCDPDWKDAWLGCCGLTSLELLFTPT